MRVDKREMIFLVIIISDPCLTHFCGESEECVADGVTGDARCVCRRCDADGDALNASEKVCGSDGITYFSLCHLQQASCTQDMEIYAEHYGPCGKCAP